MSCAVIDFDVDTVFSYIFKNVCACIGIYNFSKFALKLSYTYICMYTYMHVCMHVHTHV